jgi:ribosomal protein S18 acetylase RimI-like enzyme
MAAEVGMIGLATRLQAYLRGKALFDGREQVHVPPFTLYFNPTVTDPKEGIAIPDEAQTYSPEDINRMCAAFVERGRLPCVQYLDAFAPGLTISLQLGVPNFEETMRLPAMYCTVGMLAHPLIVPKLSIQMSSSESPLDEVKDGWNVNSRGFDKDAIPATDAVAEAFRQTLVTSRAFVAYLKGEPAAAGMFSEIRDSITELVGITTLPEYRRLGIGAALTANITRAAFDSGVEVAFLIAANPEAERVYERLGFRKVAKLLEYEQKNN